MTEVPGQILDHSPSSGRNTFLGAAYKCNEHCAYIDVEPNSRRDVDTGLDRLHHDTRSIVEDLPTPSSLEDLDIALKSYYKQYLAIQRISGDPMDLKACNINLAVIETPEQREKEIKEPKTQDPIFHRMLSYEEVAATNIQAPILFEDLFNARKLRDGKNAEPGTILVRGRAGIGKTTLCKKLVHAYQNGLWKERFDAVIWLPLRQLKYFWARTLKGLLNEKYFARHPKQEREELVASLVGRIRDDKVLFILDGLDEIMADFQAERDIALEAFLRHLFQQKYVIITSRPSGVGMSILPKLDLELETLGFSSENIRDYLANVLEPEAAREVQDYIQKAPLVQDLANVPVQLDALCHTWRGTPLTAGNLTIAQLYQTMTNTLYHKDSARLQTTGTPGTRENLIYQRWIEGSAEVTLEYLGYLAYKSFMNGHQIEFDESTLKDAMQEYNRHRVEIGRVQLSHLFLDRLKQMSFLQATEADIDDGKDDVQHAWHFLHLTFQEYFVAAWLSQHLRYAQLGLTRPSSLEQTIEKTTAFIQEHKYDPRYEMIWYMVAGLLEGDELGLFFNILRKEPLDIIGVRHHRLLSGCLKEARPRMRHSVMALEAELMNWLQFEMTLVGYWHRGDILGEKYVFPEDLLVRSLDNAALDQENWNYSKKCVANTIRVLAGRRQLSSYTIKSLLCTFHKADVDIKALVLKALSTQSKLPVHTIETIAAQLQDTAPRIRANAAHALGAQSTLPESTILTLIDALRNEHPHTRSIAAKALAAQSSVPESAYLALVDTLNDPENCVKSSAYEALSSQSTLPESVVLALIKTLFNIRKSLVQVPAILPYYKGIDVERSAAGILKKQTNLPKSAVLTLIGALRHHNSFAQRTASQALGDLTTVPAYVIQAFNVILNGKDQITKLSASQILCAQSSLPVHATLALVTALGDENGLEATRVLCARPTLLESAVLMLITASQHSNCDARYSAIQVLSAQATLSEPTIQFLVDSLYDEEFNAKTTATRAFYTKSRLPDPIIQALIANLRSKDEEVRLWASYALIDQAQMSESIIAALANIFRGNDSSLKKLAAKILASVFSESATQLLIIALQDNDSDVRLSAIRAIGLDRTLCEPVIHALSIALQDNIPASILSAATALDSQKVLCGFAIQALIGALQVKDLTVQYVVVCVLSSQLRFSEAASQALVGALQDNDPSRRMKSAAALGSRYVLSDSVFQALIGTLETDDRSYAYHTSLWGICTYMVVRKSFRYTLKMIDSVFTRNAAQDERIP
ncbi:hypothetical protein BGX27_003084 [Mortierella sp. AM989]|nr:hypothetical protein BGX27_003084 [Mortierella sp. AM989]